MSLGVAAILLAAGNSRRMGRCKQLLPLGTRTVLQRCIDTLQRGGVDSIVAVVSESGNEIAVAADQLLVKVAVNREADGDMASSIRTGREALGTGFSGVIVALCDYPLVAFSSVQILIRSHAAFPDSIITLGYHGKRGHPLLVTRSVLDELHAGMTLRDVVQRNSASVREVSVDDPGILIDMDTPDDYARISLIVAQKPIASLSTFFPNISP